MEPVKNRTEVTGNYSGRSLLRSLERFGYRVLKAGGGAEALKQNRPETKVIFITGYAQELLSEQGVLDQDIQDGKPINHQGTKFTKEGENKDLGLNIE